MAIWPWLLGGAAIVALAGGRKVADIVLGEDDVTPTTPSGGSLSRRQVMWGKLELLPITNTQRFFMMLTAYGEGRYSPSAHNTSTGERSAAKRAVENLSDEKRARILNCGVPASVIEDGSWGTFQQLGPYFSNNILDIFGTDELGCALADPRYPDLDSQIISAMYVAYRLGGYDSWKAFPTVGNLRLGWASPSLMGYITKEKARLDKYRKQAEDDGLPIGLVDMQMGRFPKPTPDMYFTLRENPVFEL